MAKTVVSGRAVRLQLSLTAEQHRTALLRRILSYFCQQGSESVASLSLTVLLGLEVLFNMFCNSLDLVF